MPLDAHASGHLYVSQACSRRGEPSRDFARRGEAGAKHVLDIGGTEMHEASLAPQIEAAEAYEVLFVPALFAIGPRGWPMPQGSRSGSESSVTRCEPDG